jgi:hypothetical protein
MITEGRPEAAGFTVWGRVGSGPAYLGSDE